jgi:bifunctional non-homologous end joining protein LigD
MPPRKDPQFDITHRDLMLATSGSAPLDTPGWLYELKYDGFRVLVMRKRDRVRLLSRRGKDLSKNFPEIIDGMSELPDVVLDGELVILDARGVPQFDRLRRRALLRRDIAIQNAALWEPAAIFVFDILSLSGRDLRKLPLLKRREIAQTTVRRALGSFKRIRVVQHVVDAGSRLYQAAQNLGLEGVMAKRADSIYRAGRTRDWVKVRTPHGPRAHRKR